jgi:hypothetical protein
MKPLYIASETAFHELFLEILTLEDSSVTQMDNHPV